MPRRLTVFFYHNVSPSWWYPAAEGAAEGGFATQVQLLRRLGTPVTLGPALDDLDAGRELPPRAFAVTFDDGYEDNVSVAAPILERLDIPATCFLAPGFLGGDEQPWWERLGWALARARRPASDLGNPGERLKSLRVEERARALDEIVTQLDPAGAMDERVRFLDWDGARELARRGFELGSHTQHHPVLTTEPPSVQLDEMTRSRDAFAAELGASPDLVAYPHGGRSDYDATSMESAAAAGYRHAVTTVIGVNGPDTPAYEIRRVALAPARGLAGLAGAVKRGALAARGRVASEDSRSTV